MLDAQLLSQMAKARRNQQEKDLLSRARQAAAWGVPDNESTGYSQSELVSIISRLVRRVEELENQVSSKHTN